MIGENSLGVVATLLAATLVGALCFRRPALWQLLVSAAAARLALAWLIYLRVLTPPGTQDDVVAFEAKARLWSLYNWSNLIDSFDPSTSYVISWVGAVAYKLFGPSPIMLSVIACVAGVLGVLATYKLARLWASERAARAAAWIAALFPYSILYSSVFGREPFISLAFAIGVYYSAKAARKSHIADYAFAIFWFSIASIFHGAFVLAIAALAVFLLLRTRRDIRRFVEGDRTRINGLLVGVIAAGVLVVGALLVVNSGFTINKVGEISELSAQDALETRLLRVSDGGSAYPSALVGSSAYTNPAAVVGRIVYFVFSPFPWDIKDPIHLLGLFATVTYIFIFYRIWRARGHITKGDATLAAALIVLCLILAFGVSVDNIGTAIRHRTKFLFVLAALAAPALDLAVRKVRFRMRLAENG